MTDRQHFHDELGRVCSILSEHFSSVQIVATQLQPDGGTVGYFSGSGDWYARKGACMEFVERDQAQTLARVSREVNEDES